MYSRETEQLRLRYNAVSRCSRCRLLVLIDQAHVVARVVKQHLPNGCGPRVLQAVTKSTFLQVADCLTWDSVEAVILEAIAVESRHQLCSNHSDLQACSPAGRHFSSEDSHELPEPCSGRIRG